jgi:hypothetical protein
MTNEEMQELCNTIVEGVEQYFETYDWDKAFKKYLEVTRLEMKDSNWDLDFGWGIDKG